MEIIANELEARERSVTPTLKDGRRMEPTKDTPSTAALVTGGRQGPIGCCYCKGDHPSEACNTMRQVKDRKQFLRSGGRCYVCLRAGHLSRNCRTRARCRQCGGRHHSSICEGSVRAESRGSTQGSNSKPSLSSTADAGSLNPTAPPFRQNSSTTCCCATTINNVLLQTAQATLYNPSHPEKRLDVSILLDSGSQRSYVTEAVSSFLDLQSKGSKKMNIMTFASKEPDHVICRVVEVGVSRGSAIVRQLPAFTVPSICEPLTRSPASEIKERFECFKGLELADPGMTESFHPTVLIGIDQYWNFVTGEYIHVPNGPVAMNTCLGWVISGPVCGPMRKESTSLITHVLKTSASIEESNRRLERQLHRFWSLESIGIVDEECSLYEQFADIIHLKEGRYEVLLPWKDSSVVIPDNYQLCVKRLYSLLRRLKQNPQLFSQYDEVIRKQIDAGILEPVTLERGYPGQTPGHGLMERGPIHYLPHHAVIKHGSQTTKVRVVYDASARSGGPSLNDCLHVGPKFNQKIMEILLRFRTHRVAFVADIEKAFLMISIHPRDRDALRFLWIRDLERQPPEVCVYRFTRVVFGVACSPFLLNATLHHHVSQYQKTHPHLATQLQRSMYVDDVVLGAKTADHAYLVCSQVRRFLLEGGFNLRKFWSNNEWLQEKMGEEENTGDITTPSETYTSTMLGKSQALLSGERKVLGVRWNTSNDELIISTSELADAARQVVPSKRQVTSTVGRFYDPLGILSPVLVPFKAYFQRLCKAGVTWDEPLRGELLKEWQELVNGLIDDRTVKVPRCYHDMGNTPPDGEEPQVRLYGFCDASLKAYAAVVYLVTETRVQSPPRLVCSKTRITPLKELTILRLELLAGLLLARLVHTVSVSLENELQMLSPKRFTDSKVVYHWIRGSDKGWKPFVQNRVNEIRRLVPEDQWYHCPGCDNPADLPSRGVSLSELIDSSLWFEGPQWLRKTLLLERSIQSVKDDAPQECLVEARSSESVSVLVVTSIAALIQLENYNDLNRLLRVVAYIFLFIQRAQGQKDALLVDMVVKAEEWLAREAQRSMSGGDKFEVLKRQLDLFEDPHGLWRCQGRMIYHTQQGFPFFCLVVIGLQDWSFYVPMREFSTMG